MNQYFKSIIESDPMPIVICDLNHTILFMNKAAITRYQKHGGSILIGRSLLDCHNDESKNRINETLSWFMKSKENNSIFTTHNEKDNKDFYLYAIRDESGYLIGYYEKHESRVKESKKPYLMG